ncbi:meso-diaminopimelate D-dehydrogenase [Enterococcus sp. DIV0840]
MIKVAIVGYGNLGRGVERSIKQNKDMELVGVFTRRAPETVQTEGANAFTMDQLKHKKMRSMFVFYVEDQQLIYQHKRQNGRIYLIPSIALTLMLKFQSILLKWTRWQKKIKQPQLFQRDGIQVCLV